jgi:hypothetical protein
MKYQIDFYEVQGTEEVFRFSKEMVFSNYDLLNNWLVEYLETSNIWKNKDMMIRIETTMIKTHKSTIFYHGQE